MSGPTPRPPLPSVSGWARSAVLAAALVASAVRIPALAAPLRPDESGYTLVARSWTPASDSAYGHYWVDRPPLLIGVFRLTDTLIGPHGIRWLAVLASALVVLAAAASAREVVAHLRPGASRHQTSVVTALSATAAAALVANPSIDVLLAKGEILAVPLLLGSMWSALRALRTESLLAMFAAGVLAGGALGLKQSLAGGVAFGVVLLVTAWWQKRVSAHTTLRLGGALALGVSVYVVGTAAWALGAGVSLSAVWYAVIGVRSDALGVIVDGPLSGVLRRAWTLAVVSLTSGLALVPAGLLLHVTRRGKEASPVAVAALAVALADGVALLLGGFFRLPYLFALVPEVVVAIAVLLTTATAPGAVRTERTVAALLVAIVVGSSVVSAALWIRDLSRFQRSPVAVMLGRSVGAVSEPGDSLTMAFGAADTQYHSGLPSPYPYLWSLPTRVRDPGLEQMSRVLAGPSAPTWVITTYDLVPVFGDEAVERVTTLLESRYERVGTACGGREVYRRADIPRPDPVLDCSGLRGQFGGG